MAYDVYFLHFVLKFLENYSAIGMTFPGTATLNVNIYIYSILISIILC